MKNALKDRSSERGSAGVKFAIVLTVILLAVHAGYNYIPVAYEAESLRTEMQTAVVQGLALPGKISPVENVKGRVQKAMVTNAIPADALLNVTQTGNVIQAHVAYQKKVAILPFGIYNYNYTFDHTATPTGFLLKQ
ncbi:MAG: hypothetical protein KA746_05615 [Pyrinomonadaceae bacterium]|nr:hypothetical protein [Pyrinomonadaceae bacterium]MBP6212750.1 hypothetical protein [Pyrinomonadaceae bacterium]